MDDAEQFFVRVVDFMISTGSPSGTIRKKGATDTLFDDVVELCKDNMDADDWTEKSGKVEISLKEHGDVVISVKINDTSIVISPI